MHEPLIQTTLRIPGSLKTAAEQAAEADGRSFSRFVCQAINEKLNRRVPPVGAPPAPDTEMFVFTSAFGFPGRDSQVSLAQVTAASMRNALRDTGAVEMSSSLSAVIPPP